MWPEELSGIPNFTLENEGGADTSLSAVLSRNAEAVSVERTMLDLMNAEVFDVERLRVVRDEWNEKQITNGEPALERRVIRCQQGRELITFLYLNLNEVIKFAFLPDEDEGENKEDL